MQLLLRPAVIAVIAVFVLLLDVAQLQDGGSVAGVPSIDDPTGLQGGTDPADGSSDVAVDGGSEGDGPADGATTGTSTGGDAASGGDSGSGSDAATEGSGQPATGVEAPVVEALTAPAVGTYQYDSSGTWQLSTDVEQTLPAMSEGTVSGGEGRWGFTLVAGPDYADSFVFTLDGDGLDWDGWSLDRTFGGQKSTTVYSCGSTDPFFVANSDRGRNIQHACNGPGGLRSVGPVISDGYKVLVLADGSEVTTVHLVYKYTVAGTDVEGEGKLELWMDPSTGLRVQEVRSITSRTFPGTAGEIVYTEDVRFTLRSLTPA